MRLRPQRSLGGLLLGENIPRYATQLFREEVETALSRCGAFVADIFEYAGEDEFASHVLDQICHWNAIGVANIVHAYAPLVVYVGGAVALNNPRKFLTDNVETASGGLVRTNISDDFESDWRGSRVEVHGVRTTGGTGDPSQRV